ncbi:FAD:protein FMN transferase [Aliidiomarina sedimenti]|uniref:FAD:protein FMN transferase n=1 Tax=Aliidiomarina sedimenti TaxID=1933879 RepID=A0ABY0C0U9_9GAMM|nr:FAD:protein FMN transferase [Aliidiomarina sedimenti]RUO30962.1 FAD:protein FMN transferase [Aliidiomarina sedimenti]
MTMFSRLFSILLLVSMLVACSRPVEPQTLRGEIFGTFFEVTLGTAHEDVDLAQLEQGIMTTLNEVDRQMSTYRDDSVLNQLNNAPLHQPVPVNDELFYVLQRSEAIASRSQGRFDHTVGGLVNLWGFGRDGRVTSAPDEDEIEQRLEEVGYHFLILDENEQSAMRTSDIFIELSGIAKGYGVDAVSAYLTEQGIDNHLVNIGGDIYAKGTRSEETRWRVGIEAPTEGRQVVQHILPIEDIALVGSGDYRNYFEENGVRYSHTIDPTTGLPISHKLAAVTVLADNATDADGYATALLVMGTERGLAFANQHDIAALFITRGDEGFISHMSQRFEQDHQADMRVPTVQ